MLSSERLVLPFPEPTRSFATADTGGSQYCTISPRTTIAPGETVPDYTVVFSNGLHRRDKRDVVDIRNRAQARQLEVLRKLIPSNPAKFQ